MVRKPTPISYPDNLYAIQMPRIPPTELPRSEIIRSSLPKGEGIYPPAIEPTTIPNIIIFFRDIAVHYNSEARKETPKDCGAYRRHTFTKVGTKKRTEAMIMPTQTLFTRAS